jgi:hypothetical protein
MTMTLVGVSRKRLGEAVGELIIGSDLDELERPFGAKLGRVEELDQEKLPILLTNKYQSLEDAKDILGDVANISKLFIEFQQHLYKQKVA